MFFLNFILVCTTLSNLPHNTLQQLEFSVQISNVAFTFPLQLFTNILQKNQSKLTHIYFGGDFNQNIDGKKDIPQNITHMSFVGDFFDRRIENIENTKIQFLQLPNPQYNPRQIIQHYPTNIQILKNTIHLENSQNLSSLTYLKFGNTFNSEIDSITFPQHLTHLIFGRFFNKPLNNNTLKTIQTLHTIKFGTYFNQTIQNLPNSLKKLRFREYFAQNLDNLPTNLTYLNFKRADNTPQLSKLPNTVKTIKYRGFTFLNKIENLPPNLEKFVLYCDRFNSQMELPNSITQLYLKINTFWMETKLPTNLQKLQLTTSKFNTNLELQYCEKLTHFSLNFDHPQAKLILPNSLTHLTIQINTKLIPILETIQQPNNITHLEITPKQHIPLELYPTKLTHLTLHGIQPTIQQIPTTLTQLTLMGKFSNLQIPQTVTHITTRYNKELLLNLPESVQFVTVVCCSVV